MRSSNETGAAWSDGEPSPGARFFNLQRELFDRHCVKDCHESVSAAANLRLNQGQSYRELVNVASQQVTAQIRVIPSNPGSSYLVRKLEGGPGIVGDQMPRLAPPRPKAELDAVRAWILQGAADD